MKTFSLAAVLVLTGACGKTTLKAPSTPTSVPRKCTALALDGGTEQGTYAEQFASGYDSGPLPGSASGLLFGSAGSGALKPIMRYGKISPKSDDDGYLFVTKGVAVKRTHFADDAGADTTVMLPDGSTPTIKASQVGPGTTKFGLGSSAVFATVQVNNGGGAAGPHFVVTGVSGQIVDTALAGAYLTFKKLLGQKKTELNDAFAKEQPKGYPIFDGTEYVLWEPQYSAADGARTYAFLYVRVAGKMRSGEDLATTLGDVAETSLRLDAAAPAADPPGGYGIEFGALYEKAAGAGIAVTQKSVYDVRALPRLGVFSAGGVVLQDTDTASAEVPSGSAEKSGDKECD